MFIVDTQECVIAFLNGNKASFFHPSRDKLVVYHLASTVREKIYLLAVFIITLGKTFTHN